MTPSSNAPVFHHFKEMSQLGWLSSGWVSTKTIIHRSIGEHKAKYSQLEPLSSSCTSVNKCSLFFHFVGVSSYRLNTPLRTVKTLFALVRRTPSGAIELAREDY